MTIRIKNWAKHQHFKDRTPPWIKLYRDILDDPDWHELDGDTAKVLVSLWLIASEDDTHSGALPEPRRLAFRLRITEEKLLRTLKKLRHWLIQDDIKAISQCHQPDDPETERETERETEAEVEGTQRKSAAPKPKPAKRCPQDFEVTVELETWARENCPRVDITRETARLRNHEFKRTYSDWAAVWRNWMLKASEFVATARASPQQSRDESTKEAARLLGFELEDVIDG